MVAEAMATQAIERWKGKAVSGKPKHHEAGPDGAPTIPEKRRESREMGMQTKEKPFTFSSKPRGSHQKKGNNNSNKKRSRMSPLEDMAGTKKRLFAEVVSAEGAQTPAEGRGAIGTVPVETESDKVSATSELGGEGFSVVRRTKERNRRTQRQAQHQQEQQQPPQQQSQHQQQLQPNLRTGCTPIGFLQLRGFQSQPQQLQQQQHQQRQQGQLQPQSGQQLQQQQQLQELRKRQQTPDKQRVKGRPTRPKERRRPEAVLIKVKSPMSYIETYRVVVTKGREALKAVKAVKRTRLRHILMELEKAASASSTAADLMKLVGGAVETAPLQDKMAIEVRDICPMVEGPDLLRDLGAALKTEPSDLVLKSLRLGPEGTQTAVVEATANALKRGAEGPALLLQGLGPSRRRLGVSGVTSWGIWRGHARRWQKGSNAVESVEQGIT